MFLDRNPGQKEPERERLAAAFYNAQWRGYTLGDFIREPWRNTGGSEGPGEHEALLRRRNETRSELCNLPSEFQNTIAGRYWARESRRYWDKEARTDCMRVLTDLVAQVGQENGYAGMPDDQIACHLRMGDLVWSYETYRDKVMSEIQSKGFGHLKNIVLVTGTFAPDKTVTTRYPDGSAKTVVDIKESVVVLLKLRDYLCLQGMVVQLRVGRSPDEDFFALSTAKNLVVAQGSGLGGGFAQLLNSVHHLVHPPGDA